MTILQDLLALKRHREQQAEMALQTQRRQLDAARQRHEKAVQELMDFHRFAQEKEHTLYQNLYHQTVHVRDIDYALSSVAALRTHEDTLQEHTETLEAEVDQAQYEFNVVRDHHLQARRTTEKFIELAQVSLDADLRESARQEDLEIEEAASLRRDQDEWSNHEEVDIT